MGGGGGKILDSPKTGDNSEFEGGDDLKNDDQKDTAWENPTYKTFEEYYSDFNISKETITEKDYTGKGSLSNPYVVHSTKGFLYLMNYEVSNISLTNKYLELACDIVLNDETFDKDGNVYGGDGVVYNWDNPNADNDNKESYLYFNGKNHKIIGFYAKNDDSATGGSRKRLFPAKIYSFENVDFENVFMYGGGCENVGIISSSVTKISKVSFLSGFVVGKGGETSVFASYADYIYDSVNYVDVYSYYQGASGFIYKIRKEVKNCINYGNIFIEKTGTSSSNGRGGGLVQNMEPGALIEDCVNYGNVIQPEAHQGGGIVAWAVGTIKNCINYGKICGNGAIGGIVGYKSDSNLSILNCENYGELSVSNKSASGAILGSSCYNDTTDIFIENCYVVLSDGVPIVGNCTNTKNISKSSLSLTNCKADVFDNNLSRVLCLSGSHYNEFRQYNISNIEINIYGTGNKEISLIFNKNSLKNNYFVKNIVINIANENAKFTPLSNNNTNSRTVNVDGLIVNQAGNRCYYGVDFSGFYCDWKSGNIGLKALNGKGFYQGSVSESVLQEKGFVKKVFPA